ncbi:hypothetical protein CT676_41070 [Bradyrhizobium sp. MOS001]|uniref:hypothetical protein n=1 Tax=unclassified Bradyrhizobium TaxID=2631580 RepID=UPI001074EF68|nr:hypothetical protein [Bradyrhizobium sp. MOS001]TFW53581.1 hypothetical protein CT676_41070 [Bradyrhizobium sp. MOS001]
MQFMLGMLVGCMIGGTIGAIVVGACAMAATADEDDLSVGRAGSKKCRNVEFSEDEMLCVTPGESGSDGPLKQKPDEAFHARDAGRSNGRPDRDRGLRDDPTKPLERQEYEVT